MKTYYIKLTTADKMDCDISHSEFPFWIFFTPFIDQTLLSDYLASAKEEPFVFAKDIWNLL